MSNTPKEDQNKETGDKFDATVKRMLETPPKPKKMSKSTLIAESEGPILSKKQ